MFEYVHNWLRQIETNHGVNPTIFAVLYFAGVIPFWLSIYKILKAIKDKNYTRVSTFGVVLGIVIIVPFTYVAIFGYNIPVWFWIVAIAIIVYSAYSVIQRINRVRT
jgi:hypothetical protein